MTFSSVSILSGRGQQVLLTPILLPGRWRSRRRQHKQVNVSVVGSNVLLVLSGLLSVSISVPVPPLPAVLWSPSASLWSPIGRAFFGWRFGDEFL